MLSLHVISLKGILVLMDLVGTLFFETHRCCGAWAGGTVGVPVREEGLPARRSQIHSRRLSNTRETL